VLKGPQFTTRLFPRCSIDKGCQTDFGRQASCTVERNLCRARNGG
jgi:hypothetical protein